MVQQASVLCISEIAAAPAAPEGFGVLGEDGEELIRPPVVGLLLDRPGLVEELLDLGK